MRSIDNFLHPKRLIEKRNRPIYLIRWETESLETTYVEKEVLETVPQ